MAYRSIRCVNTTRNATHNTSERALWRLSPQWSQGLELVPKDMWHHKSRKLR